MTAREMFEELGYNIVYENNDYLEYVRIDPFVYRSLIKFDYGRQIVFKRNSNLLPLGVTSEEHKAIHQQLKELGWLDE